MALASILRAAIPSNLDLLFTVVDNNSADRTRAVVERFKSEFKRKHFELQYVFEPNLGKSFALNTAVRQSSRTWLAFIDDDEEVFPDWFEIVERSIRELNADYFSGVTRAPKNFQVPSWAPVFARDFVFAIDSSPNPQRARFEINGGVAIGGNLVVRRSLLEKVGPYDTSLGPVGAKRKFSCEDHDMSERLVRSGACGYFLPELQAYHYVHPNRQRKSYFRRWYFDHAISTGLLYRKYPDMPTSRVVDLWRRRRWMTARFFRNLHRIFTDFQTELYVWEVLGFLVGSYWYYPGLPAHNHSLARPSVETQLP